MRTSTSIGPSVWSRAAFSSSAGAAAIWSPFGRRCCRRSCGTPYYLKIDVESHEWICLKDLATTSVEAARLELLAFLGSKGYRQFKGGEPERNKGFLSRRVR